MSEKEGGGGMVKVGDATNQGVVEKVLYATWSWSYVEWRHGSDRPVGREFRGEKVGYPAHMTIYAQHEEPAAAEFYQTAKEVTGLLPDYPDNPEWLDKNNPAVLTLRYRLMNNATKDPERAFLHNWIIWKEGGDGRTRWHFKLDSPNGSPISDLPDFGEL